MLQEIDQFASVVLDYDPEKRHLGSLCARNHDYKGTGKSLRVKNKANHCIECHKLTKQAWRKANPDKVKAEYERRKVKPECQQQRAEYRLKNRDRRLAYNREYHIKNRDTKNAKMRAYKKANPEKLHIQRKTYYEANKEILNAKAKIYRQSEKGKLDSIAKKLRYRAKKKAVHQVKYTTAELKQHLEKFNNQCCYCGKHIEIASKNSFHSDHFIPISKGGCDVLGNIVLACPSCNYSKVDHDPYEWFKRQSFYDQKRWNKLMVLLGKSKKDSYNQLPLL